MKSINWLGVIVATIVAFFAGFLWYGLLFEAEWKSLTGVTGEGGDPMWMLLGVVQTSSPWRAWAGSSAGPKAAGWAAPRSG